MLSVSYLQLSLNKCRESQVSADSKRAFYMAEAGISESFAGLIATLVLIRNRDSRAHVELESAPGPVASAAAGG